MPLKALHYFERALHYFERALQSFKRALSSLKRALHAVILSLYPLLTLKLKPYMSADYDFLCRWPSLNACSAEHVLAAMQADSMPVNQLININLEQQVPNAYPFYRSVYICVCVCPSVSMSVTLCLCLLLALSEHLWGSQSFSLCLYLSLGLSLPLSLSVSVSLISLSPQSISLTSLSLPPVTVVIHLYNAATHCNTLQHPARCWMWCMKAWWLQGYQTAFSKEFEPQHKLLWSSTSIVRSY